jgi:hypothetical protein
MELQNFARSALECGDLAPLCEIDLSHPDPELLQVIEFRYCGALKARLKLLA